MSLDQEGVREMLIACMPPGARELYDLGNRASDVSKWVDAVAAAVKTYATDVADTLRRELLPSTADELLLAWERGLGVDMSRIAQAGTASQRTAQVISRLREFGAATPDNIYAAMVALCGPTAVTIVEHSRAAVSALNTHSLGILTAPIGMTATGTLAIGDNAPASQMGAQLVYNISTGTQGQFQLTLTAPDAQSKTWQSEILVDGADHVLFWPDFAGGTIDGTWTIQVDNTLGGAAEVQVDRADIFAEGIGRATSGAEGLGSPIFEWSALVNEAVVGDGYSRDAAQALVRRWNPAHCTGGLALYQTDGGATALSDDTNCIADLCICS